MEAGKCGEPVKTEISSLGGLKGIALVKNKEFPSNAELLQVHFQFQVTHSVTLSSPRAHCISTIRSVSDFGL